jgi:glycosyltransferase involved in cell wall biosynthesis
VSGSPEVTIVIPTRDRWQLLCARGLTAALSQQDVEFEVIVVDDASADPAPRTASPLDDPRVRVIRRSARGGPAGARNTGVEHARGSWLAFLDDDDVWAPWKLRRQLDAARAAGADLVYAAVVLCDESLAPLEELPPPDPARLLESLVPANLIPAGASNLIARTESVRRVGGFDERLAYLADWDLWIRLARAAAAAAAVPEVLVGYVDHAASMRYSAKQRVAELDTLAASHADVAERMDVRFGRREFAHWVAEGDRRGGRRFRAARIYALSAARHRSGHDLRRALGSLAGDRAASAAWRLLVRVRGRPALAERQTPEAPPWLLRYAADERGRGGPPSVDDVAN